MVIFLFSLLDQPQPSAGESCAKGVHNGKQEKKIKKA
jgi:hypothetical protein